jgi:hypothetical protein
VAPLIHVRDCVGVFVNSLELLSPRFALYNVAQQNLRLRGVAEAFWQLNPSLVVRYDAAPGRNEADTGCVRDAHARRGSRHELTSTRALRSLSMPC